MAINTKTWQQFLNTQGEKLYADGRFGPLTVAATKRFQKMCSLEQTGQLDDLTLVQAKARGLVEPVDAVTQLANVANLAKEATDFSTASPAITEQMLGKIFPNTHSELRQRFLAPLNQWMPVYAIDTYLRSTAFIATGGYETDYLRSTVEYASGKAYEGRIDLGNTQPGDGPLFRGHGFFMTTGRFNHRRVTEITFDEIGIDFEKHPEKLAEPDIAVRSACIFWKDNKLQRFADSQDFFGLEGKVNRGSEHRRALDYDDRLRLFHLCQQVIPQNFSFAK